MLAQIVDVNSKKHVILHYQARAPISVSWTKRGGLNTEIAEAFSDNSIAPLNRQSSQFGHFDRLHLAAGSAVFPKNSPVRLETMLLRAGRLANRPNPSRERGAVQPTPDATLLEQQGGVHYMTARLLLVDWTTVALGSVVLVGLGLVGIKLFYVICGVVYKRRSCKVLANLVFEYGDYPGYITVLSRRGFRFQMVNRFQAEALGKLLAERRILDFDVVINDRIIPVVLDPVDQEVVTVFFLFRLNMDQWRRILALSLTRPVFSVHQPIPDNEEFRQQIMASRKEKIANSLLREK